MELANLTHGDNDSSLNASLCNGELSYGLLLVQQYRNSHGYVAILICIAGILGNLANVVVLSRPKMSTPVNYLLMIIAIADLILLVTYLPMALYFYIIAHRPDKEQLHSFDKGSAWFLYFTTTFAALCHSVAVWHTIAVASFRWLALAITNSQPYQTLKAAKICSCVLIACNILLSIPNWVTTQVIGNITDCHYADVLFWTVGGRPGHNFNNWIFACFGKILPSVLLTVLTIPLLYIMGKAAQRKKELLRKGSSSMELNRIRDHNRTTGMLLAVVVIFLCIELPHGIFIICMKDRKDLQDYYRYIGEIIDIVTLVAFSINFVLYTTMSRLFRDTFINIFCKKCSEQSSSDFCPPTKMFATFKRKRTGQHLEMGQQVTEDNAHLKNDFRNVDTTSLSPFSYPLLAEDTTRSTSLSTSHYGGNGVAD